MNIRLPNYHNWNAFDFLHGRSSLVWLISMFELNTCTWNIHRIKWYYYYRIHGNRRSNYRTKFATKFRRIMWKRKKIKKKCNRNNSILYLKASRLGPQWAVMTSNSGLWYTFGSNELVIDVILPAHIWIFFFLLSEFDIGKLNKTACFICCCYSYLSVTANETRFAVYVNAINMKRKKISPTNGFVYERLALYSLIY